MNLFSTLANIIQRRLLLASLMVILMLLIGGAGFHFLEGWGWLESLYTAAQTVTTVGYGDLTPANAGG